MRRAAVDQCWLVLAATVVFFTHLGASALWDLDEPFYAATAREMRDRGDWVVPMYNGQLQVEKPPLGFWLMINGFALFGDNEFAVRWWPAVLGIGTVLVTYHLGKRLFGARAGLWAGLVLATSLNFTVSARAATLDSALVFATTLAMLLFIIGRGSWPSYVLAYVCLSLAILTKGPVGLVLPAATIGLYLMILNRSHAPDGAELRQGVGRLAAALAAAGRLFAPRNFLNALWQMRPLTALAVVAAVGLPWYVLVGVRTDGVWLRQFWTEWNLGTFLKPTLGHRGPVYYHFVAVLIGFFPWSLFIAPMLAKWWRGIGRADASRAGYVFLGCWVGVWFVFWSIVRTKLPHHVLPAYPALALLTGACIEGWLAAGPQLSRLWLRNASVTLLLVGVGLMIAMPIIATHYLPGEQALGLVGVSLVAGGGVCVYYMRQGRPAAYLRVFTATAIVFLVSVFGFAALRVDRHQNAPALMAAIRRDCAEPVEIAAFGFFRQSMVYYARQEVPFIDEPEELRALLERSPRLYVLTTDEHQASIETEFPGRFAVLARQPRFLAPNQMLVVLRRTDCSVPLCADKMPGKARQ